MQELRADRALHALGNGETIAYGRGIEWVQVFGPPYSSPTMFSLIAEEGDAPALRIPAVAGEQPVGAPPAPGGNRGMCRSSSRLSAAHLAAARGASHEAMPPRARNLPGKPRCFPAARGPAFASCPPARLTTTIIPAARAAI